MACRTLVPGKVAKAIRQGLVLCASSPAPLATLAQCEKTLRTNPTWKESELRVFDTTLRRVLARCMTQSERCLS